MGKLRLVLLMSLLCSSGICQVHTFPATDTDNTFTGINSFATLNAQLAHVTDASGGNGISQSTITGWLSAAPTVRIDKAGFIISTFEMANSSSGGTYYCALDNHCFGAVIGSDATTQIQVSAGGTSMVGPSLVARFKNDGTGFGLESEGVLQLLGTGNQLGTITGTFSTARTFTLPDRTANIATTTGALVNGDCVSIDANGNFIDSANPCGATYTLPTQYTKLRCETGIGDGLSAIGAGTYLQYFCVNDSGVTWTITGIHCWTDNAGTSTLNAANNAGSGLLSGPVTCNNTKTGGGAAGSQSGTTTLASGDAVNFTFVADGTSKQTTWTVSLSQ